MTRIANYLFNSMFQARRTISRAEKNLVFAGICLIVILTAVFLALVF